MKKRFFGILLMGALAVASMSTFTSCKDYDDDIAQLKDAVDANSKEIKAIQALISNGGVIKTVTPIENGVKIVASNGESWNITNGLNGKDGVDGQNGLNGQDGKDGLNGKDGKDGTAWTIGTDGFWYQNGEKTEYYALGTSASSTTTNAVEASPKYYVPNAATGFFDIYQDGVKIEATNISFLETGTITATMDGNFLTLYGIQGALGPNNSVSISLNGKLASLVFVPGLYLDGIESIEYPWIGDTTLRFVVRNPASFLNLSHHGTNPGFDHHDITGEMNDYQPNTLARRAVYDAASKTWSNVKEWDPDRTKITSANLEWVYGPVWPVKYDMNPANAAPKYADDVPSWKVLEPEVIFYNTRAAASALKVSSPEYYDYDGTFAKTPVYGYADGDLTVGLQIARPDLLAPWPTDETINPNGNTDSNKSYPTGNSANGENKNREYNGTPKDNDANGHYEWYGNNGEPSSWGNWYGDGTMTSIGTYKYQKNNKDNTLALQIESKGGEIITSDYALLVPTRATLEGLIWWKQPMYREPTLPDYPYGPNARNDQSRWGDEEGWAFAEKFPAHSADNRVRDCRVLDEGRIHIYDTPEEAIADPDGAALELGALDPVGLDLKPYLGVHAMVENLKWKEIAPGVFNSTPYEVVKWSYEDVKKWGLHWDFEFVEYLSSSNITSDSRYATFSDWTEVEKDAKSGEDIVKNWNARATNGEVSNVSKTGVVIARNVTAETGKTTLTQSTSSVDREPLVRVTLKRNSDNKVMLDGYILIHIDNTKDNLEVKDYPVQAVEFNLCDPVQFTSNWHQFSRYILTDNLKNTIKNQETGLEMLAFDEWYWADCMPDSYYPFNADDAAYVTDGINGGQNGNPYAIPVNEPKAKKDLNAINSGAAGDGHYAYQLKVYNFGDLYGNGADGNVAEAIKNGDGNKYFETKTEFEDKALGDIWYDPNGEGTTNHTFHWILSEEEIEYLTHDKNEPVTVTRWLRFIAKDYTAPYPYIYVRMQLTLTRPDKNWAKWDEKNKNYWYYWNKEADLDLKNGNPGRIGAEGQELSGTVEDGYTANLIDIMAPRSGYTIKGMVWNKQMHDDIVNSNRPQLLKGESNSPQFTYAKYYFAPKEMATITALNGKKYRLTPENKNYTQPFYIINPTHAGILDDQCYISLTPTKYQYGTDDIYRKDFINSGSNWSTYDKIFCRYIWQHPYWNVENKGEYWKVHDNPFNLFTYQPMDSYTEQATNVIYTPFSPNVAYVTAGSNKIVKLKDGPAVYNNSVNPEVYNASGLGVEKTYFIDADAHKWDEKTLQGTLRWCSIIFDNEEMKDPAGNLDSEYRGTNKYWRNAGAFNDSILYAEDLTTHVYTPVARITKQRFKHNVVDQEAGNIELIHWLPIGSTYEDFLAGRAVENYACYDVLNALGYPTKEVFGGECDYDHAHRFINHQLRGWVGVVAVNDCNIAQYVQQNEYDDDNIATFLASVERPVNVKTFDPTYAIDAKTEENYVFIIDYLKMYDWRGEAKGYMWGDHYWFWAYYNIKEIDVDLRYDKVKTTLHHPELTKAADAGDYDTSKWPTLASVSNEVRLWPVQVIGSGATARVGTAGGGNFIAPYQFDLVDAAKTFTYSNNNETLKAFMGYPGTFPGIPVNKARFGGFYYENNKANVTDFYFYIPVTIHYEWGKFKTYMCWKVKDTTGYHND